VLRVELILGLDRVGPALGALSRDNVRYNRGARPYISKHTERDCNVVVESYISVVPPVECARQRFYLLRHKFMHTRCRVGVVGFTYSLNPWVSFKFFLE